MMNMKAHFRFEAEQIGIAELTFPPLKLANSAFRRTQTSNPIRAKLGTSSHEH